RAPAVGPVRVGVAVALEGGADGVSLLEALAGRRRALEELLQVGRLLAGQGLANHPFGLGPDTRKVAQSVQVGEVLDLLDAQVLQRGRRAAERADAISGLASALE